MTEIYPFEFHGIKYIYIGYFDSPVGLEWGLYRCLQCGEFSVLPTDELPALKNKIRKFNIEGKLGDETLVDEVIEEIKNLEEKEGSKKLTESINKLLTSLN